MTFDSLVHRISPTLKRITRKLNGHYSFFNDEDLYQEALTRLWIDYREGVLGDKTDSYILQGCYFHLRNYLRKVQDNVTILSLNAPMGEDGGRLEDSMASDDNLTFEQLESRMQMEVAEKMYFTERETRVLMLFMEGMSMREIGGRLGISHVMVLKIRNRIKDKYTRFNKEMRN
ncbi:MAG TPA: sigma-70 family RNA polymerase sigma factor [Syntrophorhabdaceae bacterium]|jgi:RNA polymerase sigma factor (sigma-70 family)